MSETREKQAECLERTILSSRYLSEGLADETLEAVRAGAAALRKLEQAEAENQWLRVRAEDAEAEVRRLHAGLGAMIHETLRQVVGHE